MLADSAGRFEFLEYLPRNTQGVVVKPIGSDGVLVAAADTQRGFGNIDQVSVLFSIDDVDRKRVSVDESQRGGEACLSLPALTVLLFPACLVSAVLQSSWGIQYNDSILHTGA